MQYARPGRDQQTDKDRWVAPRGVLPNIRSDGIDCRLTMFAFEVFRILRLQTEYRLIGAEVSSQRSIAKRVYVWHGNADKWRL